MSAFAVIAARHGVDPSDDEAVDRFFDERAPELPPEEREAIFAELLAADGQGDSPSRRHYATTRVDTSFRDDPAIEVPPRAVNPRLEPAELENEPQKLSERAAGIVRSFLDRLAPDDRLLLQLQFDSYLKMIACVLDVPEKPLYRRRERLLRDLRAELTSAGINAVEDAIRHISGSSDFGLKVDETLPQSEEEVRACLKAPK